MPGGGGHATTGVSTGMAVRIILAVGAAVVGSRIVQAYRRFEVAEHSMEPALSAGDYLITSRRIDALGVGNIVVFEHPHQGGFWLVKRVVGMAGDEIRIEHGRLTRNGAVVDEATPGTGTWAVGAGELFVLGDNRSASSGDSRGLGPISVGSVEGRAIARYWPPSTLGRV